MSKKFERWCILNPQGHPVVVGSCEIQAWHRLDVGMPPELLERFLEVKKQKGYRAVKCTIEIEDTKP